MTPLPSTTQNAEKRAKILDIARKRMMHYGVSKTTMSEIADDAQVAVGTIYLYFKNKDEIVLALAQECRQEQDNIVESLLQNEALTPSQQLETFFIEKFRYVTAFRTETPHGKELIAYLVQNFPDALNEWEQRFENAIARILRQGVDLKVFDIPDIEAAAHLMRIASIGFFPLPYLELPKYLEEADLAKLVRCFIQKWEKLA